MMSGRGVRKNMGLGRYGSGRWWRAVQLKVPGTWSRNSSLCRLGRGGYFPGST